MAERRAEFLRTARRHAPSRDDAEEALGRATEILLRKGPEAEPAALRAWMHVVTKREALAIVRSRARARDAGLSDEQHDFDLLPTAAPGPEDELMRRERVAHAAELLSRLKPQERRALALLGAGCSYAEIQAITGWTHTKVNRCLSEGREALRRARSERARGAAA